MSANSLIPLLERIKRNVIEFEHFKSSHFETKEKAIDYFNEIINGLYFEDNESVDRIVYAFGDNGFLKEIAINGNWKFEYEEINKEFNKIIYLIRNSQKNTKSFFGDVRDNVHTDGNTYATSPGRMIISDDKWKFITDIYKLGFLKRLKVNRKRKIVQEYISYGDTNPAIVVSASPLLIAAYAYDLDAVVILSFPQEFAQKYNLKQFDKLISVNTYCRERQHNDIFYGSKYSAWADVCPNIVDFLSDETDKLFKHKNNIPIITWNYIKELSIDYLISHKELQRKGFWFI